jgi:plastocyanin
MLARFRRLAVGAAVVASVLGQVAPAQAAITVKARCNFFSPKSVTVSRGAKIVWKAVCGTHTVTSYSSNWSKDTVLSQGQTTSRTFKSRGTFRYHCRFHSTLSNGRCAGMCGSIKVT